MRAVVITRPGGPEVLEVHERPTPTPAAGEVLVRVYASALNRADLLQREGHYPAPPGAPPDIPGMEFAGEIVSVGADAGEWVEGDRVFGIIGGGANAEYLVADARSVARVPNHLSWTDAASIPEAFITAHDALVAQAGVRRHENILIHAVGSGVGVAAVQLARAWGATPYGTARTADKLERAKEFGLAGGILVGDDAGVIVAAVERLTGSTGIDITLDLVGGPYLEPSIRASALRARIMLIGTVAGRTATIPVGLVLGKRLTLRGTVLRSRSIEEKREVTAAFVRDVVPLFEKKVLRPTVDRVFPLDEIGAAHAHMASNATFGKVVISS
jgi:NADPH2:quinone reductase